MDATLQRCIFIVVGIAIDVILIHIGCQNHGLSSIVHPLPFYKVIDLLIGVTVSPQFAKSKIRVGLCDDRIRGEVIIVSAVDRIHRYDVFAAVVLFQLLFGDIGKRGKGRAKVHTVPCIIIVCNVVSPEVAHLVDLYTVKPQFIDCLLILAHHKVLPVGIQRIKSKQNGGRLSFHGENKLVYIRQSAVVARIIIDVTASRVREQPPCFVNAVSRVSFPGHIGHLICHSLLIVLMACIDTLLNGLAGQCMAKHIDPFIALIWKDFLMAIHPVIILNQVDMVYLRQFFHHCIAFLRTFTGHEIHTIPISGIARYIRGNVDGRNIGVGTQSDLHQIPFEIFRRRLPVKAETCRGIRVQ